MEVARMSFNLPSPPMPTLPQAPAAPPMFGSQVGPGQKPQAKASQPTYLGGMLTASPSATGGGKTLLGQ